MSSDALLKGFGIGADVISQLATSKALRGKRTTSGQNSAFDMSEGELIADIETINGDVDVPHGLRRVPEGAVVLLLEDGPGEVVCSETDASKVVLAANGVYTVKIWVV